MICPACKQEYDDDYEYCPFCGADNLSVDRIKDEYEKSNNGQSLEEPVVGPNTRVIHYKMRRGEYTAYFDMDDEEEANYYEEIIKEQKALSGGVLEGVLLFVGLYLSFFLMIMYHNNPLLLVLGIIILLSAIVGMILIGKFGGSEKKVAHKEAEYLMYKVKKEGGRIIDYNEQDESIVYGLHGKKYSVTIFMRRNRHDYDYHY